MEGRKLQEGWKVDGRRKKGGLIKSGKGCEEGKRRMKEWIRQKGWKIYRRRMKEGWKMDGKKEKEA